MPVSALPKLDDSDGIAKDVIGAVVNGDDFVRLLVPDGIVRRIVATVDNLPRKTIAAQVLPIKAVPGPFATVDIAGGTAIDGANAVRYARYVRAAEAIDARRLAGFYVRLYPLFQQAYVELGYPNGYFNDRLIGVIDHLLAAPEPAAPVYLSQPRVMFEFADPGLEALSAGQKILVRVGLDNERHPQGQAPRNPRGAGRRADASVAPPVADADRRHRSRAAWRMPRSAAMRTCLAMRSNPDPAGDGYRLAGALRDSIGEGPVTLESNAWRALGNAARMRRTYSRVSTNGGTPPYWSTARSPAL